MLRNQNCILEYIPTCCDPSKTCRRPSSDSSAGASQARTTYSPSLLFSHDLILQFGRPQPYQQISILLPFTLHFMHQIIFSFFSQLVQYLENISQLVEYLENISPNWVSILKVPQPHLASSSQMALLPIWPTKWEKEFLQLFSQISQRIAFTNENNSFHFPSKKPL